ncbi:MAG: xanthine dehydrogenase family protein molybdopterin-binding subunit [Conexibacter sp.]
MSAATTRGRTAAVGRALPRREDRPLLTGSGRFIGDMALPGMVHAAFLRSPMAHARITAVDVGQAAAAPGVHAAVAAAQLPLAPLHTPIANPDAWSPPRPLLADDRVRFVGEPVAVVVADDAYLAEDAAELVEVDYEGLPVVGDPVAACEPDAPRLHDAHPNAIYDHRFEHGEPDAAFARAAIVVEREFRNPRLSATPMEGRGVLAAPEGDGVVVWSSSQGPHRLATLLAELLELDQAQVRVVCPDIGGGFGQKAHVYPEEVVVAWLALKLQRPVRWLEDRVENLLASSHARDQRVRVRVGADAEGRLLAIEADVVCDQGAYGMFPHGHLLEALGTPAMIPGPYRLEHYRFRSRAVATNKAPEGAYRGVGLPVSAFVHERVMDILAGELGIDRAEIRRRNLLTRDELPRVTPTSQRYDSGDYPAALERALELADYSGHLERRDAARAEGRLSGLGISCYVEYTGVNSNVFQGRGMVGIAGYDGAHVALEESGTVRVWTTLPAIGQGNETTFAQVVADAVGTDVERVAIALPDTSVGGLHGTGTFASRSAISGSGAIIEAGGELRRRLLEDAAERLDTSPGELELRGDEVGVVGSPERAIALRDLLADAPPERYRVSATFDPPALAYPYATHVVEVEVDPDVGSVEIVRYVIVEDCGTVINPLVVEGQIHGATAQGIGGALLEELVYGEDGQLITASLMDYLVPTASEMPAFEVDHLAIPAPDNPTGVKGVGEGGTLAPPGALANAVGDAVGHEMNELPLRPETVRAAAQRQLSPLVA